MKKLSMILSLALAVLLAMSSCSEDLNDTDLLTDGIWTFESMSSDSEDENVQTLLAFGNAFFTGLTMEFKENGEYIMTPAEEMQEYVEPSSGTWTLVDDQLSMTEDGETSTVTVDVLTESKLTYSETMDDEDFGTYTASITFKR